MLRDYSVSALLTRKCILPGLLAVLCALLPFTDANSADSNKLNLAVECRCPDSVGLQLCSQFKNNVTASPGYRLATDSNGYGIGVHFSCVDLWGGLDNRLTGRMSAVSVAFTIYSDKLPGEVYEDSSVFRVGKDATVEMSRKIIAAIGQLVTANQVLFQHMREAASNPSPSPAPSPSP